MRLIGLVLALALAPLVAEAQPAEKLARIGYLSLGSAADTPKALLQGLRELGYVEGQNLVIEYRYAEGKAERLPDLAAELVSLKVDIIVAGGTPPPLAAKRWSCGRRSGAAWAGRELSRAAGAAACRATEVVHVSGLAW